jgi:hypothetical protein
VVPGPRDDSREIAVKLAKVIGLRRGPANWTMTKPIQSTWAATWAVRMFRLLSGLVAVAEDGLAITPSVPVVNGGPPSDDTQ